MTAGRDSDAIEQTQAAERGPARTFASGRYVERRFLGEGGQHTVYLVHDTTLERDCALSFLKAEALDPDSLSRVLREAQAMARLAHPNIVTVHDFGEEEGPDGQRRPYIVCEYMSGGDLSQELRRAGGPVALERALAIAADIAEALAAAHDRGIVHRDVKPANVWLSDPPAGSGRPGSAKLGDFGIAVALDRARLTMAGTATGTAAYMAPEQAQGSEVDARSDLYALGCLLYELVTGRPPFLGDDPQAVISQHINAAPVAPSRHAEVPEALDALILRLLAKAPEERPGSAAEVAEELRRIAGRSTQAAHPASPPQAEVRRKAARPKRRTLVAGAALVAVAAVAGALAFVLRDSGPDHKAAGIVPGATLVAEGYVPKLEARVCPAELTSDPAVRCQDLVVPEDRANPAGRQIRILVMVAPSKAEPAGIPPTVFIGGSAGTAQSFVGGGVISQPAGLDVRDYGDVVAVSVRGRQFSQPMLACPEVSGLWRELLALPMNGPAANKLFVDAAERCGKRLVSEGIADLNFYGQNDIVDDVRDLAIAMGWSQINVQGSEDLSRVAVRLAAAYPGLVRSVVLADPFPVDAAWYDDRSSNANSAWQKYLAACRDDPACERAFPNLEQALPAAYAKAQQDPIVVTAPDPAGGPDIGVLLNGDRLAYITMRGLSGQTVLPRLAAVLAVQEESAQESALRTAAAVAVLVSGPDPNGDPWGANFSAYCEDVSQHVFTYNLKIAETLYPPFRVFAHDPLFELCPRWPTQARSSAIRSLQNASAVPSLILTGALGPLAPTAYVQRAAKAFTHPNIAVFPNLTTDVLGAEPLLAAAPPPCISELRLAFLRDPTANLDIDGCKAKVPPITFEGTGSAGTTPTGPTSSAP